MPPIEPLPFRIRIPGEDVIDLKGVRSVSYKVEGLLHLDKDILEFEWTATETTDLVSLTRIGTDVDQSPIGRLELPASWLAEVHLRGRWWLPYVVFRARWLDAFEGMPGVKGTIIKLRIRRRFLKQARAIVAAIDLARVNTALPPTGNTSAIEGRVTHHLEEGGNT